MLCVVVCVVRVVVCAQPSTDIVPQLIFIVNCANEIFYPKGANTCRRRAAVVLVAYVAK